MIRRAERPASCRLRSLALAALEAYEKGSAVPPPKVGDVDQAADALYVMAMARRLPLSEIEQLAEATQLRQFGFQLARSGKFSESSEMLQEARRLCEDKPLSFEANQCGATFQTAAEAYLHYKREWFDQARDSLHHSIRSCLILHDQFGYPAEMRRIHLARNIARVSAAAGDTTEAVRIVAILAHRIVSNKDAWPWPRSLTAHEPDRLSMKLSGFMLDQVLAELGRLLVTEHCEDGVWLDGGLDWMNFVDDTSNNRQIVLWGAAYRAHIVGDDERFLQNALHFVQEGRGGLSQAWGVLAKELVSVAQMSLVDNDSAPN